MKPSSSFSPLFYLLSLLLLFFDFSFSIQKVDSQGIYTRLDRPFSAEHKDSVHTEFSQFRANQHSYMHGGCLWIKQPLSTYKNAFVSLHREDSVCSPYNAELRTCLNVHFLHQFQVFTCQRYSSLISTWADVPVGSCAFVYFVTYQSENLPLSYLYDMQNWCLIAYILSSLILLTDWCRPQICFCFLFVFLFFRIVQQH